MKPAKTIWVYIHLAFLLLLGGKCQTQTPKILAGPMLGYCEHKEVLVWILTSCTRKVSLHYYITKTKTEKKILEEVLFDPAIKVGDPSICNNNKVTKFVLKDLRPGEKYSYLIYLDGKEYKPEFPLQFTTKEIWEWRAPAPDFAFLAGSCNYINDSLYDRPGKPYGKQTDIFKTMAATPAELMIWLGDNTYLREADYSSQSGIKYRYEHTRRNKDLQKLLGTKFNYAIWDDHDFGPNDGNSSFELKDYSTQIFKQFWGNKYYGQDGQGVYSKFSYSDCEFFLLDNRTFRDESSLNEETVAYKTMLGQKQLQWLKNSLKFSTASFKFICVGGQVLNEYTVKESYNLYKSEREEIISFISNNNISGVLFLTGDRHHSEIIKANRNKNNKSDTDYYPLYDITSSPLTSGTDDILNSSEKDNPMRVKGTLAVDQNFCIFNVSGMPGERKLLVRSLDRNNNKLFELTLYQSDLENRLKNSPKITEKKGRSKKKQK